VDLSFFYWGVKPTERSPYHEVNILAFSPPIPLSLYTLPYWSNPLFLIFGIWAFWRLVLSTTVPKCQKLKMVGYGARPFKKQQFGTAGVEGVKIPLPVMNVCIVL